MLVQKRHPKSWDSTNLHAERRDLSIAMEPARWQRYGVARLEYRDGTENLLDLFRDTGLDRGCGAADLVGTARHHSHPLCELVDRLSQPLVRLGTPR